MGYDEESQGYCVYFPRCHFIVIEHNVYFDKEVLEIGEVVLEGGKERTMAEAGFSNPTVSKKNFMSALKPFQCSQPNSAGIFLMDSCSLTLISMDKESHDAP